ncbi:PREDICTED: ADAMTS-like protein 1, partial [Chlamydotis macqueenii]|uniref:ADAMTS-like protein 1 n=1 Tax=Chlamydotis macqueenii TaxID=187382 RepID=UPI00052980D1
MCACSCASAFLEALSHSDQGFPVPGVFHRKCSLDPLAGLLLSLASAKEARIPQLVSKSVEAWGEWAGAVQLAAPRLAGWSCCPRGSKEASAQVWFKTRSTRAREGSVGSNLRNAADDYCERLGSHTWVDGLSSRTARSEEDRDSLWDAWGSWSECSRTCGGGASYSLRRCLSSKTCEGRNIRYRTCSNVDCPPEAGDFRAQQCSAHNDVKYQGQFYEWLPVSNDPDNPCSLKCQARGVALVVELAPKVLDGTRCYTESLDMCISGLCQIVGCDRQLGSTVKEDNCGVCNGDGSTCRLVRGQYKSQLSANKLDDTVVAIPYGSRQVRLVLKGPDHLYLETKTLQGVKSENSLSSTGSFLVDNCSIDFQKFPDKEILRISGPLTADFTVKIHYAGAADSSVQFIFYQPIIHQWRETDFFPCSASCGGGYQLTSAECFDLRSNRVVADQYCHYYPENIKPKPKLQECNLDPCPA